MDSLGIQIDTCEPNRSWRLSVHDDAVTGVAAAAEAAARLSRSLLSQGLGSIGHSTASAFTLKTKFSRSEVDKTTSARLWTGRSDDAIGNYNAPPRSLSSTAASGSCPLSTTVTPSTSEPTSKPTSHSLPASPKGSTASGRTSTTTSPERASVLPAHDAEHAEPRSQCFANLTAVSISSPARTSLKRPRSLLDVDGPFTSTLSSKKRRLLRNLVTSPLSKRFSIPATHVPNLESTIGLTAGGGLEKRFLKLAAVAAARRLATSPTPEAAAQLQLRHQQLHNVAQSELLRRAAIANRFRMRQAVEASHNTDVAAADLAPFSAMIRLYPGVQAAVAGSGLARFPVPLVPGTRPPPVLMSPPPRPCSAAAASSEPVWPSPRQAHPPPPPGALHPTPAPFALPAAIAAARPLARVVGSTRRSVSPGMTPPGSPSKGLRPIDPARGSQGSYPLGLMAASARLPSVSPRLQALASSDDDDGVAFPTSEHESRYESGDDSDDVYTDFSVMFGGGGGDGQDDDDMSGSEIDRYEEFMDDLDGIPWSAR